MSHFEERLEADLGAIRDWVWKLGEDVERALRHAKQALLLRDEDQAYAVVLGDNPINRASRTCDRLCHAFIARHLPGAGHLREIAATIRVNVALERIGDYAVTISREAVQLDAPLDEKFIVEIDALADDSFQILHDSRVAFREDNAEQAKTLMQAAKRVEHRMDAIYDRLFAEDNGLSARSALTLFVVFNLLKRVADQAKNICDQTVYAVRGVAKVPKVYRLLFLDAPGMQRGALAVAIGRKCYPTAAEFDCATAGQSESVGPSLQSFLEANGLPDEKLESLKLEAISRDLSDYDVVIGLQGRATDVTGKLPFHTSAVNWTVSAGADHQEQYRELHSRITALMDQLAGDEAA